MLDQPQWIKFLDVVFSPLIMHFGRLRNTFFLSICNAESRKRQLKNDNRASRHLYLTLPHTPISPKVSRILEAPVSSEGPCFLILQGTNETLFLKNCACLFKPVWNFLQDWCKVLVFVLHNLELRMIKQWAFLKTL